VDKHALLASHQPPHTLLSRAIQQPDPDQLAPGDLVQLAPDAHPVYGSYFLQVHSVGDGAIRGSLLTAWRGQCLKVDTGRCARIGPRVWPAPKFGFEAYPAMAAQIRQATVEAHEARSAEIAKNRRRRSA
jgi:hypothetical protein